MSENPYEHFERSGRQSISAAELFAISVASDATDAVAAMTPAHVIVRRFEKARGFSDIAAEELAEFGLNAFDTARWFCAFELGRRTALAGRGVVDIIDGPDDVAAIFRDLETEKVEQFCVLLLDTKNQVLRRHTVHRGTANSSLVGVKEFFRFALMDGATGVIAVHNHPSGDPTPSPEDFKVTKSLAAAGKLLEIPLLDHIIIGDQRYISMQRLGAI